MDAPPGPAYVLPPFDLSCLSSATRLPVRPRLFAAALAVALLSCTRMGSGEGTPPPTGPLMRALAARGPLVVRWAVRLSVPVVATGCRSLDSLDAASLACAGATDTARVVRQLAEVAARAASAVRERVDRDALHAASIVDLVAGDSAGKSLDRSISYLEMITRLDSANVGAWVDLSAALLVRAATRRDAISLLSALDAASRALELDEGVAAARHNRAVALDLLALDAAASSEWRRLAQLPSAPEWNAWARERLAQTAARRQPERPAPSADSSELVAFVGRHPFEARMFTWEALLGDWGEGTAVGDTRRAAERLGSARLMARTIAERFADSSLLHAVQSIDMVPRGSRRASDLAVAHARYALGRRRASADDYAAADSAFVEVLASRATPRVLREWATLGHANSLIYARRPERAAEVVVGLLANLDQRSHPSLAGRAHWMLAVLHLRAGRDSAGLAAAERARTLFARAGERDNVAATISLAGERASRLGDDGAFRPMLEALRLLRVYPTGLWRHNALYVLAVGATRLGLWRAAMAIVDEDAATAGATRAASAAELRLIRARSLWESGDTARAREAITVAAQTIEALASAEARLQLGAELRLTLATGPQRVDPAGARRLLDSVVAFFEPTRNVAKLIPAHVGRADAALALGDVDGAEDDLARVATLYEQQRETVARLPERAALQARAQMVVDRLVMLRLAQGHVERAWEALERGRGSFTTLPPARDVSLTPRPMGGMEVAVLDLHLVGDTLLAFVLDSGRIALERRTVPRAQLQAVSERARIGMELGLSGDAVQGDLSQLYEWLWRPVEARLSAAPSVLVVSDAPLTSIPYPALRDARGGRYVVEAWETRWSPSLADARRQAVRRAAVSRPVFVAAPELDVRAFPALASLSLARNEATEAAALYPGARVLAGAAADSSTLVAALVEADLFHFAGHALFDDARPNASRLAVAPRGLDAETIAALDLHRLRLAVLSACETMRVPGRRGDGFAGLSEAFLAAGAGGVVGSLWRVEDEATATLMAAFHRAYRERGDAGAALREAQLQMVRSESATLRAPGAWGAFRLAGR